MQVVADRADRRRDDRLVQRGQEHAEQQARQDRHDLLVAQAARVGGRRAACARGCGLGAVVDIRVLPRRAARARAAP